MYITDNYGKEKFNWYAERDKDGHHCNETRRYAEAFRYGGED